MRMGNMRTRMRETNMMGIFPKANALILLLAVLSLSGCRNPFDLQDTAGNESAEPGILSLTIGRQVVGRTIMPGNWPDKSYIVRFDFHFVATGSNGSEYRTVILKRDTDGTLVDVDGEVWLDGSGTARIELDEGTWNLTVTAFRDTGGGSTMQWPEAALMVSLCFPAKPLPAMSRFSRMPMPGARERSVGK